MSRIRFGFTFLLFVWLFSACNREQKREFINYPNPDPIVGLASAVQLQPVETRFLMSGYFIDNQPDSLVMPVGLTHRMLGDTVVLSGNIAYPMDVIKAYVDGYALVIPIKKSEKAPHTFTFDPKDVAYESVMIKGTFNAWNPNNTVLELKDNLWSAKVFLAPGDYEYILVVDGKELLDPANSDKKDNGLGGFNSLLSISGPNPLELPELLTRSYSKGRVQIHTSFLPKRVLAFWQNALLGGSHLNFRGNNIEISLPLEADTLHRSYLRVLVYNEAGLSNDLFIPFENGQPLVEAKQIERSDKHALSMYFLMVDRFKDGNPDNNFPVDDPEIDSRANYYGGDMKGVIDKIEDGYFEDLGVNTIWLSPITQNPEGAYGLYPEPRTKFSGYHGYWPIRSTVVDYRYGTLADLDTLVDEAHKQNMNVLLDYVANHVHQEHPIYQEHPDWATNLYLPDGSLNTARWDDQRLTTWFDVFLPTLDLSRPEVVEPMTDSAMYWLRVGGIDGFRHDATKHIPELFWETLTKKIKKEIVVPNGRSIYQIGETYGSKALINSYIGTGKLDAQFDFNVYDDAIATLARDEVPFSRLEKSLKESFSIYGYHNLMGYITGNQDRGRFISYASGDVRFDEDAKYAGWTRDIEISDSSAYDKLKQLVAFNTTIPGVPVIYYGDEFGLPGANDPDNRRMMKFNGLVPREANLRTTVSKLLHLRSQNPTLIYGDTRFLLIREKQWAYVRSWFGEHVVVVFNKDNIDQKIEVMLPDDIQGSIKPLLLEDRKVTRTQQKISFKLEAHGVALIRIKK